MATKLIVGSIAGLAVLTGGAVLAGRLGAGSDERSEAATPASARITPPVAEPAPARESSMVLDERDAARNDHDSAFSTNDRIGFQTNGGTFTLRESVKTDMISRFDADGDGKLDKDETLAAKEAFRAERDARRQQWLLEKYDTDGDGVLSEEERAQEDADREAREQRMRDRQAEMAQKALEAYDADGDGELSEDEKRAGREARIAYMKEQHIAMEALFDADGDGKVSGDERNAMHSSMGEMFGQMQLVRLYDANGDHTITTADMPAYMDLFVAGDTRADIDKNGVVNESDLAAFQERALAPVDPRLAAAMGWFDNAPPSVDGGFGHMMVLDSGHALIGGGAVKMVISGDRGNFAIQRGTNGQLHAEGDNAVVIIETIEGQKDD